MSVRLTTSMRLVAAGLAVLAALATGIAPAHADGRPPGFTETSTGTWSPRPWGDVAVIGPGEHAIRAGRPTAVTVSAIIAPFDRTMPEPGECERAHGWISIFDGAQLRNAWLIGSGDVCGLHLQPPISVVRYAYTGNFEVWEGHEPILGATGFMSIRLAEDGTASTFAISD